MRKKFDNPNHALSLPSHIQRKPPGTNITYMILQEDDGEALVRKCALDKGALKVGKSGRMAATQKCARHSAAKTT
jgi:hypothetical protein